MNGLVNIVKSRWIKMVSLLHFRNQIPKLMTEFEKGPLSLFTPCHFSSYKEAIKALAIVHVELVLIHPFREGNGRVARMLATLMALQAGLPPLDFSGIAGKKKKEYIEAIHAGFKKIMSRWKKYSNLSFVRH